jgi:hypothetical protein
MIVTSPAALEALLSERPDVIEWCTAGGRSLGRYRAEEVAGVAEFAGG